MMHEYLDLPKINVGDLVIIKPGYVYSYVRLYQRNVWSAFFADSEICKECVAVIAGNYEEAHSTSSDRTSPTMLLPIIMNGADSIKFLQMSNRVECIVHLSVLQSLPD